MKRQILYNFKILCLALLIAVTIFSTALPIFSAKTLKVKANTTTEVTALESNISNMNLKGYLGRNITNNIAHWQISAYEKNSNIIAQISRANNGKFGLDGVLGTDYFNVDSYYDIDVVENNGNKALGWTLITVPASWGDRDLAFSSDPTAITDWTGATELWISLDASSVSAQEGLRIAFEENSVGRESYQLRVGASVYAVQNGEKTLLTVQDGGFIILPSNFKGYVVAPLNTTVFERYFEANGDNELGINKVVQFQLALKGSQEAIGKTVFMDDFAIVGNINGSTLPVDNVSNGTYKVIWNFNTLNKRTSDVENSGLYWYGEFVGKLLTGMAYSYKISPEKELLASANKIIDDLALAQGQDGYIGTYVGGARFSISASNWDLWNHYHAISGLLEWYKITNDAKAFDIAKKAIDLIYETFKNRSYIVVGGFETNRGIAHGYTLMYDVTKDVKYLNEAERIIMQDCQDQNGWYKTAIKGGYFYQSSSNRWEVLHMIMTLGTLYRETKKQEYYDVMSSIWNDIQQNDIHNTGGFTTNESALGNPYLEGIIETCCSIAWLAYTNEYYKYNKSVAVADEFERTYYNAILGSLLDNDRVCTYNSPMDGEQGTPAASTPVGVYDGRKVSSQQDISFQYNTGSPDFNCCQANFARGLGQLSQWAVVSEKDDLYVNYYGNSSIETKINGKDVTLSQVTEYPVNGNIKLTINGLKENTYFNLKLRIPSWAYGSTLTVDGQRQKVTQGEYASISKNWKNGDVINLELAQGFTYWTGELQQQGYTSVYYGPILLALDYTFANGKTQATAFSVKDFEKANVYYDQANDCMLAVEVPVNGEIIKLVDFASAGKYRGNSQPATYYTWLTITDAPQVESNYAKRWFNSSKLSVNFNANLSSVRTKYYTGEIVEFSAIVPEGKIIKQITSSQVTILQQNDKYYFTMPTENVTVEVLLEDKNAENSSGSSIENSSSSQETTSSEQSAISSNSATTTAKRGCSSTICPSICGALAVAGVVTLTKKSKKKKV